MTRYVLYILSMALLAVAAAAGKEITRESGGLSVKAADPEGPTGAHVEIQRAGAGEPLRVELNRTAVVTDVLFVTPKRIVVWGELGSRGDILTLIDAERGQVIDTLWGWNAAVSPDLKTAGYEFRVPPASCQACLSAALVGYDLTASPVSNTQTVMGEPEERGIVLYPEGHRLARRYWTPVEQGQPERRYVSPIAWSPDSKRLAVVEYQAPAGDRLVVVDVSRGLGQPTVTTLSIWREDFLDPQPWTGNAGEYAEAYVSFRDLHFSADGRSVVMTSWRGGPFAEKTLTLPVPSTDR
jgi:hypothetical protein